MFSCDRSFVVNNSRCCFRTWGSRMHKLLVMAANLCPSLQGIVRPASELCYGMQRQQLCQQPPRQQPPGQLQHRQELGMVCQLEQQLQELPCLQFCSRLCALCWSRLAAGRAFYSSMSGS